MQTITAGGVVIVGGILLSLLSGFRAYYYVEVLHFDPCVAVANAKGSLLAGSLLILVGMIIVGLGG